MRLRFALAIAAACGALAAPATAQAGLLDFLFGPTSSPRAPAMHAPLGGYDAPAARPAPHRSGAGGGGSGRSVCVRLCDGYYYPLESVATRSGSNLSDCEASCPGVAMGVFRHPGGDSMTEARDASGRRYGDLDAAYAYRTALAPGCACQRSGRSVAGDMTLRAGDIVVTADGAMVFRGKDAEEHKASDFQDIRNAGATPKGVFAQVDRVLGFSFQEGRARQPAVEIAGRPGPDDIVVTPLRTGAISASAQSEAQGIDGRDSPNGDPGARSSPRKPGLPRVVLPLPTGR